MRFTVTLSGLLIAVASFSSTLAVPIHSASSSQARRGYDESAVLARSDNTLLVRDVLQAMRARDVADLDTRAAGGTMQTLAKREPLKPSEGTETPKKQPTPNTNVAEATGTTVGRLMRDDRLTPQQTDRLRHAFTTDASRALGETPAPFHPSDRPPVEHHT
ncbi:hypothetical protein EIP91_010288 [Steccherinum ochraceum]|uniref:Uncharacterized protein n=1 Tax=Steccherinum ochraceum TaxID=92696 RepID=A0A4R0RNI4_9APHY|nr:hypothetical protein EIP91_010288 [Steccherinum ochraceum]